MKKISVFDTSISSYNLGNDIIMEAVVKYLNELFPFSFIVRVPSMEITSNTLKFLRKSDYIFFGGTNSLSSRMEFYKQWGVNLFNSFFFKNVILMGLGWWQYQKGVSLYTKYLLNRLLSSEYLLSVRDSYTENKLRSINFKNVINTSCPTLWGLTNDHISSIKKERSEKVIFTLTDYHQNPTRDKKLISILTKEYNKVYFWIQGWGDYEYVKQLTDISKIEILNPNLDSINNILELQDIDYIGTRLHGGIRALQKGKRTIIIGIDNRSLEMQKDYNLPVIDQNNLVNLNSLINSSMEIKLNIPFDNIKKWKAQFKDI